MIQEQYVSFETAKLLKEKGFDICCKQFYEKDGYLRHASNCSNFNHPNYQEQEENILLTSAPSQSLVMRWLREVHNIYIVILTDFTYDLSFFYRIDDVGGYGRKHDVDFETYEQAAESAIKYCLENLI